MYSDKRNFRELLGMSTLERLQNAEQHKHFLGCAAERSGILSHLVWHRVLTATSTSKTA